MLPVDAMPIRGRLATQLEEWALVREKVLAKIDIRAARDARQLAAAIRQVVMRMAEEEAEARVDSMAELRRLCSHAQAVLNGSAPPGTFRAAARRSLAPAPMPEAPVLQVVAESRSPEIRGSRRPTRPNMHAVDVPVVVPPRSGTVRIDRHRSVPHPSEPQRSERHRSESQAIGRVSSSTGVDAVKNRAFRRQKVGS